MIDSDPTSVILTFYREGGEIVDQKVQAPFHYLATTPFRIKSVRVGSRVALYCNVIYNVEGTNVNWVGGLNRWVVLGY